MSRRNPVKSKIDGSYCPAGSSAELISVGGSAVKKAGAVPGVLISCRFDVIHSAKSRYIGWLGRVLPLDAVTDRQSAGKWAMGIRRA